MIKLTRQFKVGDLIVHPRYGMGYMVKIEQKALGSKDTVTLRKTRESLCEEWAAAAGLSVAEGVKEVGALLEATQPYPEVK